MSKSMSSKEVASILKAHGWHKLSKRGKGSHDVWKSQDGQRQTTLEQRADIPIGTLKGIEKQTGIQFN